MFSRRSLPAVMSFVLAWGAVAFAQQPQTATRNGSIHSERSQGEGRRHDKMGRHKLGLMRELNLTEEQRQQQRALMQRHLESTKAQREELFKLREKRMQGTFTAEDEARARVLRQEIHTSMKGIHSEIEGILTPEQRAKLEQIKTERKARHEEMRQQRQELRQTNPQ